MTRWLASLLVAACGSATAPDPPKDPQSIESERVAQLKKRAAKDFGCEGELSITPVAREEVGPVLADTAGCSRTQRYRYSWGDTAWYPTYADDEGLVPKRK